MPENSFPPLCPHPENRPDKTGAARSKNHIPEPVGSDGQNRLERYHQPDDVEDDVETVTQHCLGHSSHDNQIIPGTQVQMVLVTQLPATASEPSVTTTVPPVALTWVGVLRPLVAKAAAAAATNTRVSWHC